MSTTHASGDGVTLQTVIESARRLDELSCARVIGQLALAVHAAQKTGQPLASLTPAAVRLSAGGEVELGSGSPSPRYSAPERLRGGAGDRRTDVFALGALLWEALAHERLFEGATDDAVKLAVMRDEIRPPSELNANVPAELDAICKKALARDPADRYQSAKVMAAELDAVLDDAGYPESNEQIASYVGRLLAAAAPASAAPTQHASRPPMSTSKTAQLPAQLVPPAEAAAEPAVAEPAVAEPVATKPSAIEPPAVEPVATKPPAIEPPPVEPPARKSSGTLPPPMVGEAPVILPRKPATLPPATASEPSTRKPATLPPPMVMVIPSIAPQAKAAKTEILGSLSPSLLPVDMRPPEMPAPLKPIEATKPAEAPVEAAKPVEAARPADLALADTASPVALADTADAPKPVAPAPRPLAATAFLGSNAVGSGFSATSTMLGVSPISPVPAGPPANPFSLANLANLPAASTPPPVHTPTLLGIPAQPEAAQTLPTISTAETVGTPHLAAAPRPADTEFEDERNSDPVDVVAPPRPRETAVGADSVVASADRASGSRDVLAGWGWGTGPVQIVDDHEDFHDTTHASRKRLIIAIAGALGVVVLIAVAAFAFSGGKPGEPAAAPTTAAATPPPPITAPAPPAPTSPSSDPGTGSASAAAVPATTAGSAATPDVAAAPPDPAPPVADKAAPATPATPGTPATPAAGEAVPAPPAPPPAPPVAAAPAPAPPPPAKLPEPAKLAAAKPEPKPAKPEPARPRPDVHVEPKKPVAVADKPKHPAAPVRTAHSQPIDPYDAPADKPHADPAAAYKTGIQQYARGDASGALATFRGAASASPGFAPTWRGLGLVYEKLGNKGQARSAFKKYLQLAPGADDADLIRDRLERLGS